MSRHRLWNRTGFGVVVVAAMIALLAACGKPPDAAPAPETSQGEAARLQRRAKLLQHQVDLAGGKNFYLVLDPDASDLTLMLNGAELQRYQVLGIQIGLPRVSWFSAKSEQPWRNVVWTKGELDPARQIDRLVVQAAPPGTPAAEAEATVPPTPEEMYPVPSRYHVRFSDGLSVEVRPREADEQIGRFARLRATWSAKWRDVAAAMRSSDRDAVRLRLVLKPKDADSLYRSLPPDVKFIVLDDGVQPAVPSAR